MSAAFPGATQGYGSSSPMSMDVIPTQTMPGGDIYNEQGQFLYNANNPMAGMGGGQMPKTDQAYNVYFDQMYKPGMNSDDIRRQFYAMTPEQQASYATPGNQYENTYMTTLGGMTPGDALGGGLTMQQPSQPFPNLMQNPAFNPIVQQPQQLQNIAQGQPTLVNQLTPPPPGPGPGVSITQQPPPFPTPPRVNMDFLRQPWRDPGFLRQPAPNQLSLPGPQPAPQPAPKFPNLLQNPSFAQPQARRVMPTQAPGQTLRTGPRMRPGFAKQNYLNRLGR